MSGAGRTDLLRRRYEILVGISCKFSKEEFAQELTAVGLEVVACYTDRADGYGMFVASAV